jgi:hypothetical protein
MAMTDRPAPILFHRWCPPPSQPPSDERLKAAILLGQQMAEQEAASMLTAKVRRALSGERDRVSKHGRKQKIENASD